MASHFVRRLKFDFLTVLAKGALQVGLFETVQCYEVLKRWSRNCAMDLSPLKVSVELYRLAYGIPLEFRVELDGHLPLAIRFKGSTTLVFVTPTWRHVGTGQATESGTAAH
jgi:hypothetical protein